MNHDALNAFCPDKEDALELSDDYANSRIAEIHLHATGPIYRR